MFTNPCHCRMFPVSTVSDCRIFGAAKTGTRPSRARSFPIYNEEEFQMKPRLLLTTAIGLVFATAALAQAPRDTSTSPTTQTQTPSSTQKSPEPSTGQAPSFQRHGSRFRQRLLAGADHAFHFFPAKWNVGSCPSADQFPGSVEQPGPADAGHRQLDQSGAAGTGNLKHNSTATVPKYDGSTALAEYDSPAALEQHHGAATCQYQHGAAACAGQPAFEYGAVPIHQRQCAGQHQQPAAHAGH
jgi:hypothetical protein